MPQSLLSPSPRQDLPQLEIVARDGKPVDEPTQKGRTLTGESPLIVLPGLACEVGLPESVFLQQLHYWLTSERAHVRDGRKWVYNSIEEWLVQFPFWKKSALHRIISTLEERAVILGTAKYNATARDRRKWYTINYEHPCLSGLDDSVRTISRFWEMQIPEMGNANPENGKSISRNREMLIGTETTTETTTEKGDTPLPPKQAEYPAEFETFWKQYPSGHGNKKKTAEAWKKLRPEPDDVAAIMAGLARWNACDRWRRGYVKDSVVWLRDRWWQDEPPPPDPMPPPNGRHGKGEAPVDFFVRMGGGSREH